MAALRFLTDEEGLHDGRNKGMGQILGQRQSGRLPALQGLSGTVPKREGNGKETGEKRGRELLLGGDRHHAGLGAGNGNGH